MDRNRIYEEARVAVARLLAQETDEPMVVRHLNEATRILWPHLSQETQSSLVLR